MRKLKESKGETKMNILLCCAAGMSTSLLVTKMENHAKNEGKEYKIWAVSADAVKNHIDEADVLLLGPQVRYLLPQMKKLGEERSIPVAAINPVHYGTCNGAEVLKTAASLVNS
ncbi:PTS sugar transporter subunit IIB [Priestia filamentosa]|uniref:PTS sugar transporter subunit IIB n=1 Tax=Priestia filamentosa TaxID=1402861 RepID=UPI0023EAB30E|nr:PTS sugar transporter subunit IIB [Priestia filamentosa]MED3725191.1 PTS sugar transporter subunit IIB [Priestia filamentosa]